MFPHIPLIPLHLRGCVTLLFALFIPKKNFKGEGIVQRDPTLSVKYKFLLKPRCASQNPVIGEKIVGKNAGRVYQTRKISYLHRCFLRYEGQEAIRK